jgi:acetaldehyde dehydrogenase (acetylating)
MANYIMKNDSGLSRVATSEDSKTFWESMGLTAESCTDEQYDGLIRSTKSFDQGTWNDVERNDLTFNLIDLRENLDKHIAKVKLSIENHTNEPASWTTHLSELEAIDLNSLVVTPGVMPTVTGKNWVDALMNNSISVPLVLEV